MSELRPPPPVIKQLHPKEWYRNNSEPTDHEDPEDDPGCWAETEPVADVAHVAHPQGEEGDLATLMTRLETFLARFVAFPTIHTLYATVAWVVHCHTIEAFESTPRLAALSAEKGSGKTRLMEILELFVPNPMLTVNISPAALFRKLAEGPTTVLLDEADTYLGVKVSKEHEDLRGLVNAGHRRGAVAYRCVISGKGVEIQEYPAFAPVALAGIGDLPDTILDRSIVIAMKRRAPHEQLESFRHKRASKEAEPIRQLLSEWAEKHVDALSELEPDMPDGIVDRPA